MFTIYSIGDSAFLAQILNALAMICGTGDFKTLVGVGALLGLLVMGFQCLTSGTRQFNLHQVLIGMICYMCFFGPGVTVQVEDAYTDEVRVVDNVPLGAAAAGTIISNIGYGVTALFEQGYGTADRMTKHAFLEPLKVLTGVRSAARDVSIIEAAGKAIGNADLAQDIDNYLRECTMVKITLGQATPDAIYRGGTNELFYDSSVYGTHLSTAGDVTCAEATAFIRQSLGALGQPDAAAALNRLLNIKEAGQTAQHLDKVDSALQMLDAAGNNGTQYLQLAVLQPLYDKAAAGFYKDMGDTASAVMVNQAIEQRNQQWAAEGTMFVSTMRPLMAFFEGFIYAITPLMGFLLVVGAFGLNMLGKYFQVVIWIQLWMPVMSIINLYISMAARNEFSALVTAPISFYTLNSGSQALQTWLGVGGMLTAATPMIALFLVTGSTYAFTALAGRMGGADHVNERIGSPDMIKPGGYLQQADHFKSDQVTGTSAVGFTEPTYSLSTGISNAVSQLNSKILNQSDAAVKMAASNNASGMVDQTTRSVNQSVGQSLEASNSQLFNSIKSELISQGAISGTNADETRQAVGAVATQLAANVGVNVLRNSKGIEGGITGGITGNISGSGNRSVTTQSGDNRIRNVAQSVSANLSKGDTASLVDAARYGVQHTAANQSSESTSHTDSSGLSSTLTSVRQAMDSYSDLKTLQNNASSTETRTLAEWVNIINANPQTRALFQSVSSQISGEAAIKRNIMEAEFRRQEKPADVAHAMANFQVIGQFESLGGEAMKAQIAAPSSGVSANERLVAPVQKDFLQQGPETISHDGVKSQVKGVTFNYAQHAANMQAPADQVVGGEAMVKSAHENFEKATVNEANANREEMRAKLVENAMQKLFAPSNDSLAQEFMGMFSKNLPKGSYSDQIKDLERQGFTHRQANAMLELRHSEDLRDDHGNLTRNGQALHDEIHAQLGGDKADLKTVDAVFNQMVKHLDAAADADAPSKAVSVLAYNDAMQGVGSLAYGDSQPTSPTGAYFDFGTVPAKSEPSAQPKPKQEKAEPVKTPTEIVEDVKAKDDQLKKNDHFDNVYRRFTDEPDK